MNKNRRNEIRGLIDQLTDINAQLDILKSEEEEALENLPESLQDSERGENMQNCIDNMEYAYDAIDSCIDYLNEVIE